MKHNVLRLGFEITMDKGHTWRPLKVNFWNQKKDSKKFNSGQPLKYMGDALMGLSLIKLNDYVKSPVANPGLDYNFALESWKSLEPHIVLYERSSDRIRALQSQLNPACAKACTQFENQFNDALEMAMTSWGVDLAGLGPMIEAFNNLEKQIDSLILFNFNLSFSKSFMEKLHTFYSFLFHLRSVIAVDHNARTDDASHESVKIDSILDYIPRADYVTNDALLYWNFKKLAAPFSNPKTPDPRVDKLFASPMEKAFLKYSNNAYLLVNNLPSSFLNSLNPLELEEALYLVQMDWLLGSPAGLLFKIREELYGVQSGYEKVFWKDSDPHSYERNYTIHQYCELTETLINGNKAA